MSGPQSLFPGCHSAGNAFQDPSSPFYICMKALATLLLFARVREAPQMSEMWQSFPLARPGHLPGHRSVGAPTASDVSRHPHQAVQLMFFENCERFNQFFPVCQDMLPVVLAAFLDTHPAPPSPCVSSRGICEA